MYKITTSHNQFKTTTGAAKFIQRTQERNRVAMASGRIRGMEFSTSYSTVFGLYTVKIRTERLIGERRI